MEVPVPLLNPINNDNFPNQILNHAWELFIDIDAVKGFEILVVLGSSAGEWIRLGDQLVFLDSVERENEDPE